MIQRGLIAILLATPLSACTKSDVERCVDARMAAFDENNPDGVSNVTGQSRKEARAQSELLCLRAATDR